MIELREQQILLLDQMLLRAQDAAQLELADELAGKGLQGEPLGRLQTGARRAVEHAQCAERHTLGRCQQWPA